MLKRTLVMITLLVLVAGTLMAQPMMNKDNCNMKGNVGSKKNHKATRQHSMNGMQKHDLAIGMKIIKHAEDLKLTDKQINDIKDLAASFKKKTNTMNAEIKNLMIDKREAIQDEDFAKAKKIVKSVYSKKEELALESLDTREDICNILTTQQKVDMKKLMKDGHKRMK